MVCQCTVHFLTRTERKKTPGVRWVIRYCPLHTAAGDLLEACKDAEDWIAEDERIDGMEDCPSDRLERIRAAIKKAEEVTHG